MEENTKQQPELTKEERLEIEERAIQALIDMGVKFSVPLKINPVNPPKYVKWWNRMFPGHVIVWRDRRINKDWNVTVEEIPDASIGRQRKVYMRHFHIKPLYLGTIDRIRSLYIQIEFDEERFQDNPTMEGKRLFRYIRLVAEIAAVAVINDPSVSDPLNREVVRLRDFFIEYLTVSRLKKLAGVIAQMMNAGDFTSSIRSIREIGTTKPKPRANLVEKS